jgi:ubiquinone/menaquinone biosynthesis C-methylase UbiE
LDPLTSVRDAGTLARAIEGHLACPRCHDAVSVGTAEIRCLRGGCGFTGSIADGIAVMREHRGGSFFDDKHEVMEHGSAEPGVRRCCYSEQATVIESAIPSGAVVVDVGCGPALPYRRAQPWVLIGVDLSYESLRANTELDIKVYGSAADLPLADRSVDAIVSLYAIHHFGGQTRRENERRVARGFAEFGRVLKPGGSLFIFELSPWWLLWQAQCVTWNLVRKIMPSMDIFFWRERQFVNVAAAHLGRSTTLRRVRFHAPTLTPIPPVFACPGLKIPRFLFPFDVHLYHWTV